MTGTKTTTLRHQRSYEGGPAFGHKHELQEVIQDVGKRLVAIARISRVLQQKAGRAIMVRSWRSSIAAIVVTLAVAAHAGAQITQTFPMYPDCEGLRGYDVFVPRGTPRVPFTWAGPTSVPFEDVRYHIEGYTDHWTYLTGASWSIQVKDAGGGVLASQSGSTVINPYTWSCNYWTTIGCIPQGVIPGTVINGEQMLDVTALAAAADTVMRVETRNMVGRVKRVRTLKNGETSEAESCNPYQINASGGVEVPAVHLPRVASPENRMIMRLTDPEDKDRYSSYLQRKSTDAFPGVALGTRPQFLLNAYTTGLPANSRIWFRVIDPPDSAAYTVSPAAGDNRDSTGGVLYMSDGRSAQLGTTIYADTDGSGSATVALEGADQYAGDNYEVLASVYPPGGDGRLPCEAFGNCATTDVITLWKRIYYEHIQMPAAGAFLREPVVGGTAPCSPAAPCEIHVWSTAVNGTDVMVPGADLLLIGTNGNATHPATAWRSESVTVDADSPTLGPAVRMQGPEDFLLRLTTRPANNYSGGPQQRALYDAVVAPGGSWAADPSSVQTLLESAFVEYVSVPSAGNFPWVGVMTYRDLSNLMRWLPWGQDNRRFIIGADRYSVDSGCGTNLGVRVKPHRYSFVYTGTLTGATQAGAAGSLGVIYPALTPGDDQAGALPGGCGGRRLPGVPAGMFAQLLYGSTAHEAVHQFNVHPPSGGHCSGLPDYTGTYRCLMDGRYPLSAANNQLANLIINLHSAPNSEYTTIREEVDPSR